jgi:murein DD-endopeptidase MepM/ murein hydrolase activator NlpD
MFPNPVSGPIHPASWERPPGNLEFEVTSYFGPRVIIGPDGKRQAGVHKGLDIGNARTGANVLAQGAGKVVEYRPLVDGVVTIQTPDGKWRLVSAHMTGITVRLGSAVAVGQVIGKVGMVGATAPHLHFENKELVNGSYIPRDPWRLLAQNAGGGDDVTETTITLFPDGPHTMNIPAGGKVDGWTATGTAPSKSQTFPNGSSFPADASVVIDQTPNRAPEGRFYRCTAGIFAGLYIPSPQVTDAGPVNPPSGEKQGAEKAAAAAQAVADAL